ncbi:MAG: hypothetical protein KatS3mg127_2133 [Silanimonas sp.]|nr:MAG: hypothetical protein KatS3mg127_0453 [Silanimonas sp.]GIX38894.1 MAG: hypothetical protein KatS3mg127_2133 [Silanimonas sp.]
MRPSLLMLSLVCALGLCAPSLASAHRVPKPDLTAVDQRMQALVAQYRLEGASLWVSQDGTTVFERHYGAYEPETRVPIASASKWVSALVLARLVEKGLLRWDSTVGEHWPDAAPDKRGITLAQLFSHTSGLPGEESGCLGNPLSTLQACAAQILAGPMVAAPGTAFAYGGLSMQVAGAMAERATGLPWDTLFQRELVQPLGLVATDYGFTSSAPGYLPMSNPRIAGGVRSTLGDYRRLMAMWQADGLIAEGPDKGQRYLASSTLRAMQLNRAAGTTVLSAPPSTELYPGWGYGFGFWLLPIERAGAPMLESSPGAFGFQGWVDGTAGIAAVFLVRDANLRMAPEVKAIQEMLPVLLDRPRWAGNVAPAVPACRHGADRQPPPSSAAAPRPQAATPAPPPRQRNQAK